MGALDQGANGDDGLFERARSSPRTVVAIAAGAVLLLAWIGWAIHVTSSNGASAGLGVVIAWPAMLAAVALISLPFIGGYLLVRRLSTDGGAPEASEAESEMNSEDEEHPGDEEEGSEDEGEDADESDDEEEESEDEDDTAAEEDGDSENEAEDAEKAAD